MILQAATPYVPNQRLLFPTPSNNFHLRMPNKHRGCRMPGSYPYRRGMGDTTSITLGCGGDLASQIQTVAAGLMADPSTAAGQDAVTALTAAANQICSESVAGAAFGCPAMTGCDSTLPSIVASLAPAVQAVLTQFQASAQGQATYSATCAQIWGAASCTAAGASPTAPVTTVVQPTVTAAPPVTPPPVINPPATQSNGVNQTTTGSGAGQSNTTNPTSVLPAVSSIPDWVWYVAAGGAAILVISMVSK
jgi:flagellar hook-length control protein FliK